MYFVMGQASDTKNQPPKTQWDIVDEAAAESFPASDPPAHHGDEGSSSEGNRPAIEPPPPPRPQKR